MAWWASGDGDPTKKVPQLNFGNENNRNAALARSPRSFEHERRRREIALVDRQN